MNKSLLAIIIVAVVGIGGAIVILPYFTESTVDEALPSGAITQSEMEDKQAMMEKEAMEKKAMEEKAMMEKEAMEKKAMEEKAMMEKEAMEKKAMEEKAMMEKEAMEKKAMEEKAMMEKEAMEKKAMEEKAMMEKEAMEKKAMEEKAMMEKEAMEKKAMEEKAMMEKEAMEKKAMEEKMSPKIFSGTFVGVGDGIHDAQGIAKTIPLKDGSDVLRFENFKTTNGPDLYVYLATDDRASDFVNLGTLKASNGNQNYDIPDDTDLSKYNKVLIWCKAFGVLFGSADLSSS